MMTKRARGDWPGLAVGVLLLLGAAGGCSSSKTPHDGAADLARDVAPADLHATPDTGSDRGAVADCAAIGATSCFGNVDCATDRRCENVGSELEPVACCVVGARGSGAAGTSCASENDCASAVCIAGSGPAVCSKDCATAADCPAGMKRCIAIAMSGSPLSWCFPES